VSWPMVKLGDVCQITMGQAPSGSFYNEKGQGYALIAGAGDFGKLNPIPKKYTTKASKLSKFGDIIICIRATIGDLNWSDKEYCLGRGVAGLRGKESLYQGFLWHCLNYNKNVLSSKGTGSTFKQISRNHIEELIIPLPPIEEQKRIAAILDKADGIRQKREQAIKLADDFLHTMFQKTFNSQSFLLNGWEQKELKDIALIQTGPFGTQLHKEDYIENGIPLINPTNIKNGIIIPNFKLCVERHKYDKLKEYHLKKGDIIMGRRGEMGRCALINDKEDGWFCGTGSLFIRLNTPNEILSFYLNEYLSSEAIKNFLKKESRGVTMANLNKDIVGKIKINIPSANALTSFMKVKLKVDSIKKKINHSDLETLLSSLSKKYF